MKTEELELIRERWRRRRQFDSLVDRSADDFARGGLGEHLPPLAGRLLILPSDPERHGIDFDPNVREWWQDEYDDPATGGKTSWGPEKSSSSEALLYGYRRDGTWQRYLALGHDGSVEAGLDVGLDRERFRGYFLTRLVHRVWMALIRFSELVGRLDDVEGPFELTLAMTNTKGALLGDFGQGWAEPGELGHSSACDEPALLLRREIGRWDSDSEGIRDLAFNLGGQVEDSWGVSDRRFLNYRGENAGTFAADRVRWH